MRCIEPVEMRDYVLFHSLNATVRNMELYIPAAFGGGDNRAFLIRKEFRIIIEMKIKFKEIYYGII
jgi:hypothetical protein